MGSFTPCLLYSRYPLTRTLGGLKSLPKDALLGRRFADDDVLKHGVRAELRRFSKEFYFDRHNVSRAKVEKVC